jgi:hypothetical protein
MIIDTFIRAGGCYVMVPTLNMPNANVPTIKVPTLNMPTRQIIDVKKC